MFSARSIRWTLGVACLLALLAVPGPARALSADLVAPQGECYEFAGGLMCFVDQPSQPAPPPAPPHHPHPAPPPDSYPGSYGSTYVVRWGDTMSSIACRLGIPLSKLIAANPQIWNPNLIYAGQIIYLPSYYGQPGYHG